jgi:hypothetical protein
MVTIRLDLPHAVGLGQIMGQIRLWLKREDIHATGVKSAEVPTGMTVDQFCGRGRRGAFPAAIPRP